MSVAPIESIHPPGLAKPSGYAHGRLAPAGARWLAMAGQIGWDEKQCLVGSGITEQFAQALRNLLRVLHHAGGRPEDLMRMTIYVVCRDEYLAATQEIGQHYRSLIGKVYPAMALVEVSRLLEEGARVEISADAAIPAERQR